MGTVRAQPAATLQPSLTTLLGQCPSLTELQLSWVAEIGSLSGVIGAYRAQRHALCAHHGRGCAAASARKARARVQARCGVAHQRASRAL